MLSKAMYTAMSVQFAVNALITIAGAIVVFFHVPVGVILLSVGAATAIVPTVLLVRDRRARRAAHSTAPLV